MRNITHHAALLVACIALGCASAEAEKRSNADVTADQLPQPVAKAAADAAPGLEITDARRLEKRKEVLYRLKGADADGKQYTLTVTESGEVRYLKSSKKESSRTEIVETTIATPFRKVGLIAYKAIRESSGVVASRKHPNILWTHNDKGNTPELYAITREGKFLARYTLPAVNNDWEDIDTDDQGRLYVGRIGNNDAKGSGPIEVLRVAEPDVSPASAAKRTLAIDRRWRVRYPAEPFDCESLVIHGAHGYLISKHLDGAAATLYRFDLDGPTDQTLAQLATLPIDRPVTGASISPDGNKFAVLTYGTLYVFEHGGDLSRIGDLKPVTTPTPSGKLEGVCFTPDGILLTAESRQIYLLDQQPPTSTVSVDKNAP